MIRVVLIHMIRKCTPRHRKSWSSAMEAEIENIRGEFAAIIFGLGCLLACGRFQMEKLSMPERLSQIFAGDNFAALAIIAGTLAGAIGLIYLTLAGAPSGMILINGLSLAIGLLIAILIRLTIRLSDTALNIIAPVLALSLLAVAMFGQGIEGANRWLAIGPYVVQPSLILLPLVVICYARLNSVPSMVAVMIGAVAMALQPDRAMAGMLFLAVLTLNYLRPTNAKFMASIVCAVAFVSTMILPDRLTAVPFVDHILWTAFDIGLLMGIGLWLGCLALLAPVIFLPPSRRTSTHWVFAACWCAVIAAAAMGAYPTPIVGYGASAIIGYFLSVAFVSAFGQTVPYHRSEMMCTDRQGDDISMDRTLAPVAAGYR